MLSQTFILVPKMTHSLIIHRKLVEKTLHEGDLEIILCFIIIFSDK